MEERKEIDFCDLEQTNEQHKSALLKIKNHDFTNMDKNELLTILKFVLLPDANEYDRLELYTSIVVDSNNQVGISAWLVKHRDWITSEHFYIYFSPFDVWMKTNTRNIYYKHKSLTNAWRSYLLKKYPIYLNSLSSFLTTERLRLHSVVDKEIDDTLRMLSIQPTR